MTVYDDLRLVKGYKKHTGTYGVEIETETLHEYMVPQFKFWKHDEDHSLRNFGIEYMLKAPLSWEKDIDDALMEFEQKTNNIAFDRNSNSTSVHVHMNMLDEEWGTMATIFTTYALFENLLIRWSGPSRRSNLFCLPICDAEAQYEDIIQLLKYIKKGAFQQIWNFDEKTNKYAALNFVPLTIHGSIEFRSFRGDPSRVAIKDWINILNHMLLFSRSYTPDQVIDLYRKDKLSLLERVFGGVAAELLLAEAKKQGDDPEKIISQNFWYAASIALWNKDWSNFGKIEKIEQPVSKAFNKFCMDTFGKAYSDLSKEDQDVANIVYKANGGNQGIKPKLQANNIFGEPLGGNGAVWIDAINQAVKPQPPMNDFLNDLDIPDWDNHEDED